MGDLTAKEKSARGGWVNQTLALITEEDMQGDRLDDGEKAFVADLKDRASQGNYKRDAAELAVLAKVSVKLEIKRSATEETPGAPVCRRWSESQKKFLVPFAD